ncbi:MAG: hypothetical protein ABIZ49_00330 [Opitutaceae bacterium]
MNAVLFSVVSVVRPVHRGPLGSLLFAGSLFFLGGCASTYNIKVDALSKPTSDPVVSYEIHNKNPLIADDSLRYKEAAAYVKTALSGKGLYEAPSNTKADIVVDIDYGIGPPQTRRETLSEPVYITMPGQTRTQTVQVGTDRNGNPIYQTIVTQDPPTTEFAGYREYQVSVTVYEKYLRLTARTTTPVEEGRPSPEIWTVDVTSEGESRDLRKNLPVLVAASIDYIGKDTQGQKSIKLKDSSSDVAFVKKGM